jgi:hypothetical protein
VRAKGRLRPQIRGLIVKAIDQCEERHVSGGPAVHGSMANLALGIAPLPERKASCRHFVFGPAIGAFEDHHFFRLSDGDNPFSEEDFGLHAPAIRAFKLMDREIAAGWMLLNHRKLYRLAASRTGIVHEKVKRHSGLELRC